MNDKEPVRANAEHSSDKRKRHEVWFSPMTCSYRDDLMIQPGGYYLENG